MTTITKSSNTMPGTTVPKTLKLLKSMSKPYVSHAKTIDSFNKIELIFKSKKEALVG